MLFPIHVFVSMLVALKLPPQSLQDALRMSPEKPMFWHVSEKLTCVMGLAPGLLVPVGAGSEVPVPVVGMGTTE